MRTILIILQKEFRQIFRNRAMLPILFVMPVVQLLVLSFAATFEVSNTRISLVDDDRTPTARSMVDRLTASTYFTVASRPVNGEQAEEDLLSGATKMILHIPRGLERDLLTGAGARIQILLNAEDGAAAGIVQAYAGEVLQAFNRDLQIEYAPAVGQVGDRVRPTIRVEPRHWYNPHLEYTIFMVPGILVLLVTMIGTFLSAMNVVREKEIGTIEQLNVTPIRRYQFVVGKLLPFWILALIELAIGLVIARIVFHVPMLGSMPLVFALAGLYLLVMLGFGLWISTITSTQQQAMFVAWFVMVIFILMSGLFTPIESMPQWAQHVTLFNPIAYFIEIMRRVMLKGAGFSDVLVQFWALVAYATVMLSLAVRQHRKVTA